MYFAPQGYMCMYLTYTNTWGFFLDGTRPGADPVTDRQRDTVWYNVRYKSAAADPTTLPT